jgi:hypothetical protein
MKKSFPALRLAASALVLCGGLVTLGACSNNPNAVGPSQAEHGPMGSTATPGQADIPDTNSQSTPVMKP